MAKTKRLSPIERQILMFEMFRSNIYIDHDVINQFFPFVENKERGSKLPKAALKMVNRDFKTLRDAGVIAYEYNSCEDRFESKPCDINPISEPDDPSYRLNLLCRYLDAITDLEEELCKAENTIEEEMDDTVFDYMNSFRKELKNSPRRLTDPDLYRYDDPYVAQYIITGGATLEQVKADISLFTDLGYLDYDIVKRRFYMPDPNLILITRQDYGVRRGADGKLYITTAL